MWWLIFIIPAFGRLREEEHQEFEATLLYIERPCLMKTTTKKKKTFLNTFPFILNPPLVSESAQIFLVLEVVQAGLMKIGFDLQNLLPNGFLCGLVLLG